MSRALQDSLALLRGLQIIAKAACQQNEAYLKHIWINSSAKEIVEINMKSSKEFVSNITTNPSLEIEKIVKNVKEVQERTGVVMDGFKQVAIQTYETSDNSIPIETTFKYAEQSNNKTDPANLDISSITLKELEQILAKHGKDRQINLRTSATKTAQVPQPEITKTKPKDDATIKPTSNHPHLEDESYVENVMRMITGTKVRDEEIVKPSKSSPTTSTKSEIHVPELSSKAKQRKVPSSRIGRIASFGQLFAGLGFGTINELTKNALGLGGSADVKEALFSPANTERIVDTLCRVRGAALKIGQILSIQDSTLLSPELVKAFERVRQAADYMPDWQVNRTMTAEFGSDWRNLLKSFENKPFAAASIGQVHRALLKDGREVAIKIQYPGVAQSIESDIDNLISMLKVWDIFPKGFFIDNVVKVAKRELKWEVDYIREAEYTEQFKLMISPYPEYYVPHVIKELTTKSVLTTELVPGLPLDKCFNMSYDHRKNIASSVLKLCLRELFELRCMQTDPNWSNFLYDEKTKRLMLIDFGATRFYPKEFIQNYRDVIIAAANDKPEEVLSISKKMGFLTGYETKQMEEAHTQAVMILGEIFRYDGDFNFGKQKTTEKIAKLVPTMVAHRLCPPPEEIYSIHRKLSGVFLLCARLNVKMNCRVFYEDIVVNNA